MERSTTAINSDTPGILPGRLERDDYALRFCDSHAPLNPTQALIESERCYYCRRPFVPRLARPASMSRSSFSVLPRAISAVPRRRFSNPMFWAECARGFARRKTCARKIACAKAMNRSRLKLVCCSVLPPMPVSVANPGAPPYSGGRPCPDVALPSSVPGRPDFLRRTGWRCSVTMSCCSRRAISSVA